MLSEVHRTWDRPEAREFAELYGHVSPNYAAVVESYVKAQWRTVRVLVMYSVEVFYRDESGEISAEKANIPCASSPDDAQRIMREWLAARCDPRRQATHARLLEGDQEICSQCLG